MSQQSNNQATDINVVAAPAPAAVDPAVFDKNEIDACIGVFAELSPDHAQRFSDAISRIAARKSARIAENIDELDARIAQRDATILSTQRDLDSVNAQLTRANETIAALQRRADELEQLKTMIHNASRLAIVHDGVLVAPTVIGQCPKCAVTRGARAATDLCPGCVHANNTSKAQITATFARAFSMIE